MGVFHIGDLVVVILGSTREWIPIGIPTELPPDTTKAHMDCYSISGSIPVAFR